MTHSPSEARQVEVLEAMLATPGRWSGDEANALLAAVRGLRALRQGGEAVPTAWAAHRFGRFGYIWHEQDDVQGWIDLRNRAMPDHAQRWHGPVPLYALPPPPAEGEAA